MFVATTIKELKEQIALNKNKTIGFVPTMGALHEGHLSLVKKAQELSEIVVVSIFVNKAQFNNISDYENYPQNFQIDIEKLSVFKNIIIFLPAIEEMLPNDLSFKITPNNLTDCLCGKTRPGHFDGVALILTKFFNIVRPNVAIFGDKDFQQLMIVKKLVKDLNFDLQIIPAKAVREESGLVLSSRNQRLNNKQKELATNIYRILQQTKTEILNNPKNITQIINSKHAEFLNLGFDKIDYFEARREEDLQLVTELENNSKTRLFIAVFIGEIRLIDNLAIN